MKKVKIVGFGKELEIIDSNPKALVHYIWNTCFHFNTTLPNTGKAVWDKIVPNGWNINRDEIKKEGRKTVVPFTKNGKRKVVKTYIMDS